MVFACIYQAAWRSLATLRWIRDRPAVGGPLTCHRMIWRKYQEHMWTLCENHVKIMWKLWEDSGDNYGEKLWGKLWRLGKICWHRFWLRESGEDGTLLRWGGKAIAWSSKCIYVHMSLHESMGFYHISLMKTKNYLWNIWKGCIVNGYTYIYLYIIYILCRFKNAVVRQL